MFNNMEPEVLIAIIASWGAGALGGWAFLDMLYKARRAKAPRPPARS